MNPEMSRLCGFVASKLRLTLSEMKELGKANDLSEINNELAERIIEEANKTSIGKKLLKKVKK